MEWSLVEDEDELKKLEELKEIDLPGKAIQTPRVVLGKSPDDVPGLIGVGNVDILQRPPQERYVPIEENGKYVLAPMLADEVEARSRYQIRGENVGVFKDAESATEYAKKLEEWNKLLLPKGLIAKEPSISQDFPSGQVAAQVGLIQPGNINLDERKPTETSKGIVDTEFPMLVTELDKDDKNYGKTVLIPTIIDGKAFSRSAAIRDYEKTGQHLGVFNSELAADEYAKKLRARQEEAYGMESNAPIQFAAQEMLKGIPRQPEIPSPRTGLPPHALAPLKEEEDRIPLEGELKDEWEPVEGPPPSAQNVKGTKNREELIHAIEQAEKAGYKVPHFIGTENEPEGDRAPTIDQENLVAALKKQEEDQRKAGNTTIADGIAKDRAYWENKIKTEGMSAEQWKKQTGEPEPGQSEWEEVEGPPEADEWTPAHNVGIVTAYRPGGDASMGLSPTMEGGNVDAHGEPILGRTTMEDYAAGNGDYVTVAMDKNSSWQNQFLSSPNFPDTVFRVRDNGGYGNGKTGENWVDIAFSDPQKAKSMLLRGVPFTPITADEAQKISESRPDLKHTPKLRALAVPGGSFSYETPDGLPDPFVEVTARTVRGAETGIREMFGGALSITEAATRGERNVYADEEEPSETAQSDIPRLEEQIATLQKQLKDQTLKEDPESAKWVNDTTFDSPEIQKLDKQLRQARRAAAGDLQENILGSLSRQTERLASEAEKNQVAAMKKYQPYISEARNTKWGFMLADALGTTVPGVLASIGNPIFGVSTIYAQIYQASMQQYMAQNPEATREEAQKFANDQALAQAPWAIAGNQLTARALKASFATLPAGAVERGARIFGTQVGQAVSKNAQAFIGNVGSAIGQSMMSDMVSEDYDLLEDTDIGQKFTRSLEPASLAGGVSLIFGGAGMAGALAKRPGAKPKAEAAPPEVPTVEITIGPKALPAPKGKAEAAPEPVAEVSIVAEEKPAPPKYSREEAETLALPAPETGTELARYGPMAPGATRPAYQPALPPSTAIVPGGKLPKGHIISIVPMLRDPVNRAHVNYSPGERAGFGGLRSPIGQWQRFFIGTAEVLEKTPGLEGLGQKIRDYVDDRAMFKARDHEPFRKWEKSVTAKEKGIANQDFHRFFLQANDPAVSVQKKAIDTYWSASDKGRELIDLTRDYLNRTGIENQAMELVVFDHAIGEFRPIGKVAGGGDPIPRQWYPGWKPGYFPRMIHQDHMKIINDPTGNVAAYEALKDHVEAMGFPRDSIDAHLSNLREKATSNEFFASLDLARTSKLPNTVFDYSFETVRRYMSARAERLSQIKNFGQVKAHAGPESLTLFDKYLKNADNFLGEDVHMDKYTKDFVERVRNHILNIQVSPEPSVTFMSKVGTALTGIHLGNPVTAARNLAGGQATIAGILGAKHYMKGVKDAFTNIDEAYEKGIIIDDLSNLMEQAEGLGRTQKFTNWALKWSGEQKAENFNRMVNFGAAKSLLRDALDEYKTDPLGRKSREYFGHFKRMGGIDPQALIDEGGSGPMTDRYLRQSVRYIQGGYQIDQTPVFQSTTQAKFFFKYSKWGTQHTDLFSKEVIRPAIRELTGGKYKQEFVEIRNPETGKMEKVPVPGKLSTAMRYFLAMVAGGAAATAFTRYALGIEDKTESWAEIVRKMDKDGQEAFFDVLHKMFQYSLISGFGGYAGNLTQYGLDWTQKVRQKDPLNPPIIELFKDGAQLLNDAAANGGLPRGRDLDEFLRRNSSAYRTGKQGLAYWGNDVFPLGFRELKRESMLQDLKWLRGVTGRYEKEHNVSAASPWRPGVGTKTEMTRFNYDLKEALLLGDVRGAKRLIAARERGKTQKELDTLRDSMMDSVRSGRPIKIGGSTSQVATTGFLQWADKAMSKADSAKLRRMDKTYTDTAVAAGVLEPAGKHKRKQKSYEEWLEDQQVRTKLRETR